MIITYKDSLQYYDCDIIFEAEDDMGKRYVAVHSGEHEDGEEYNVFPVDGHSLDSFKSGQSDLRNLIMTAPDGTWYKARLGSETQDIVLSKQDAPLDMPAPGYFLLHFKQAESELP